MRILGIDPGLQATGYGVIETGTAGVRVIEAGVVRPTGTDLAERIASLYDGLSEVIAAFQPESMAVEQLYAHYDHPRTAILMGHARGVVLLAAAKNGLPVASFAATRIKKTITGHGRASKTQMQHAIQRELKLVKTPEPPDVADALAVALTHHYAQKSPIVRRQLSVSKKLRTTNNGQRTTDD
jgi:crossover junction endodeoxyribonuclease RuvC